MTPNWFRALTLAEGTLMLATSPERHTDRQHLLLGTPAPATITKRRRALSPLRATLGAACAFAVLVLAPAGASASAGGCPGANTPAVRASRAELKAAVICLIDQQRVERGLPALVANTHLSRSAQGWTRTMVAIGAFTHGSDFAARITQAGFEWSAAGENIATGFVTPSQVVDGWMGSQGHCQNILDPGFTEIGVGVVLRPVAHVALRPATWTADFGLPTGVQPPSHDTAPMAGCPYKV